MRNSIKTVGALAGAAVVIVGGSAFTNSGAMPGTAKVYGGYGSVAVTGATVTNAKYAIDAEDISKIDSVTFTATENVGDAAGYTSKLNFNATDTDGSGVACVGTYTTSTAIVCTFTAPVAAADITNLSLTVAHTGNA